MDLPVNSFQRLIGLPFSPLTQKLNYYITMNTYFEGGVDIEWFKDYCQLSDHVESAWVNFSKQIIFNDKVFRISELYYSEFQCEVISFLEDFEQKEFVIYFESMTKSKNNYFMKLIHNDQPSLNINSLNYSYKTYFN